MSKALITLALLALFFIASASRSESLNTLWGVWKSAHHKHYAPSEEIHRFTIFQHNLIKIAKLNAEHTKTKFGLNQFADLTESEFEKKFVGGLVQPPTSHEEFLTYPITEALPESVDWRYAGAVTPVKDQRACGSCWAFAAVAALESFYFINQGKLQAFSEQQMVDCVTDCLGCQGGWHNTSIAYAARYGVETSETYPYTARTGRCSYEADKAIKVNSGVKEITPRSSEQLKAALLNQPVAVAIRGSDNVFQFYKSGVIGAGCGTLLNHAVLAVGYQKVNGQEAFIVKNSWGMMWGMQGYGYISTSEQYNNGDGACGILTKSFVPI